METTFVSGSLNTTSLPFTSLPIKIQLFQTEILLSLIGVMFLFAYIGYRYIRQTEVNIHTQGIDTVMTLDTEIINAILFCIQENRWLEINISKHWYEKLLSLLESLFQINIDRSRMISTQSSIPSTWRSILSEIEKARYSQHLTYEQKENLRISLINELIKLQNIVGNSSIQSL